ncbi:DUF1942 domain-containing protein (plasmid) [Mycolicibacterium aichiense]|uniref:MPT63 family protein n=1 Tax=Mycolicibacterium aichiense TaxID=1799 RepID=UPI003D6737EB
MTQHRFLLGATVGALTGGLMVTMGAPSAYADDLAATTLGNSAQLINGPVVQRWTVSGLKPSADVIPYPVAGTLWEATATDEAVQGNVTPVVSNFNARTTDGQDYRVLFGVATPQGVNPATLPPGGTTSGKIYFDVTGPAPTQVVYNAAGQDLALWRPAPPPASGGNPATRPAPTGAPPQQTQPGGATTPPAATSPAAGAPLPTSAAGSAGNPLAPGTPIPGPVAPSSSAPTAGSAGTPLPTNSAGTPLPADSAGTPVATPNATAPPSADASATPSPTPAAPAGNTGAPVTPTAPPSPTSTAPAPAVTPQG